MKRNILAALLGLLAITATLQAATVSHTLTVGDSFSLPPPPPGTTSTYVAFDSTVTWQPTVSAASTLNLFAHVWVSDGTSLIDAYTPTIYHTSTGPSTYTDVAVAHGEGNFIGTAGVSGVNFAGGITAGALSNKLISRTTVLTVTYTYTPNGDDDDDDHHHGKKPKLAPVATLPLTEFWDLNLAYNDVVAAPVARPGLTNVIVTLHATANWYLYANNPTDHPTNYMTDTAAVAYLINGATVSAESIREQHSGWLPQFTSEFVQLFAGKAIDVTWVFSDVNFPGELLAWQQPHTLQVFPYLNATSVGCGIYGTTLSSNSVYVSITYQYKDLTPPCDDDDDKGGKKGHGKPEKGRK